MPSITVAIPDKLKHDMDALTEINWSAVAREAFAQKISEVQAIQEFKKNSTATEQDAIQLGRLLKKHRSL